NAAEIAHGIIDLCGKVGAQFYQPGLHSGDTKMWIGSCLSSSLLDGILRGLVEIKTCKKFGKPLLHFLPGWAYGARRRHEIARADLRCIEPIWPPHHLNARRGYTGCGGCCRWRC